MTLHTLAMAVSSADSKDLMNEWQSSNKIEQIYLSIEITGLAKDNGFSSSLQAFNVLGVSQI